MTGGKPFAVPIAMLGRLFKPAPMIPIPQSELRKSLGQVQRATSPYTASTPFLKHQHTNIRALAAIVSIGKKIPFDEILPRFRKHLASTKHPLTIYEKLKLADELTKEACLAILFNRNLTSYADIKMIADETAIPASYIVTKLIELGNQPNKVLESWYSKVPSISSLWNFIKESGVTDILPLPPTPTPRMWNIQSLDHSIQQYQMDLAAHMWWNIRRHGVAEGHKLWSAWSQKDIPRSILKQLLRPSSLRLIRRASESPESLDTVIRIVQWDDQIMQVLSPESTRKLMLDLLAKPSLAAQFLQHHHGAITPIECAKYSEMILRHWLEIPGELKASDSSLLMAKKFARWALEQSEGKDFHTRASLQRLSHQLAELSAEKRRHHEHSTVLDG